MVQPTKPVLKSKTVWTGVIVIALAFIFPMLSENFRTEIALAIEALVFIGLRLVTNRGLHVR